MNKEEMISYYDLLKMIKDKTFPDEVIYHLYSESVIYKATYDNVDSSFECYEIKHKEDEDSDFRFYLSECFLESDMFEKNISISKESNKIDKLMPKHISNEFIQQLENYISRQDIKCIAHKINEIINYLQHISKGENNE